MHKELDDVFTRQLERWREELAAANLARRRAEHRAAHALEQLCEVKRLQAVAAGHRQKRNPGHG